jgi:hypothetical protein
VRKERGRGNEREEKGKEAAILEATKVMRMKWQRRRKGEK